MSDTEPSGGEGAVPEETPQQQQQEAGDPGTPQVETYAVTAEEVIAMQTLA